MSRPARFAMTIMVFAAVILVATVVASRFVHGPMGRVLVIAVLHHGAEGALIGGVCDFIAVAGVYSAAKTNFHALVQGVSETVVKDFVAVRRLLLDGSAMQEKVFSEENMVALRARLSGLLRQLQERDVRARVHSLWEAQLRPGMVHRLAKLDLRGDLLGFGTGSDTGVLNAPEAREVIARCIDEIASNHEIADDMLAAIRDFADSTPITDLGVSADPQVLARVFADVWAGAARARFIHWLAELDLRADLQAGPSDLMTDRSVRKVIAECVRATAQDDSRLERTVALLRPVIKDFAPVLGTLGATLLRPSNIRSAVQQVALAIERDASDSHVPSLLGEYAGAYLDRWHMQPVAVRRAAAARVADTVIPSLLARAAEGLAPQLGQLRLGDLIRPGLDRTSLQRGLRHAARALRSVESAPVPGARNAWAAVIRYVGAYLSAWHELPEPVRLRAAESMLASSAPRALDKVFDIVWEHRMRLVDVDALVRSDSFRQLATTVVDAMAHRAGPIEAGLIELLAQQLGSQGPDAFAEVLRQRTQAQLDMIKVNGTLWGLLLGAGAGLLSALVEHL